MLQEEQRQNQSKFGTERELGNYYPSMHFMGLYSYLSSWSYKTQYGDLFYFHYFHQKTASEPESSYHFKLSSCFQVPLIIGHMLTFRLTVLFEGDSPVLFINYICAENKQFSTQQTCYSQSCNRERNKNQLSYLSTTKALYRRKIFTWPV